MAQERKWWIEDSRGRRQITLAEYRADLDARHAMAQPIAAALRSGDLDACAKAQAAMRNAFPD